MSEGFPTNGDPGSAAAVKIIACNETDWQQEYLAAVRERNSALSAAQAEIARLKSDEEQIAKLETEETLSGYSAMFSKLLEQGRSPEGANAYVVARATFDYTTKISVMEAEIARLREESQHGVAWFNGFQCVQDWMSERNWWTEKDIKTDDPSDTLISGLERKDQEIARLKESLKPRILGVLDDYAGMAPEEGENWESWFHAAFDLAKQKVSDVIDAALSGQPGESNVRKMNIAQPGESA